MCERLFLETERTTCHDVRILSVFITQVSLAAARKSLTSDNTAGQPGRDVASPRYDSEEGMSMGSRTPGASTPINGVARETNGTLNAVGNLVKEFDQRRHGFDDEAKALIEVKPGNPDEELRKLKHRFESWKKEYKARLRETKTKLHKHGHSEEEKRRRKWWGKISTRSS